MSDYRELKLGKGGANALVFLMVQMLGLPSQTKLGKIQSDATTLGAPKILDALLNNVMVLGDWVREANATLIKHRVTRRFYVDPYFDHAMLKKHLAVSNGGVDVLPGPKGVRSGYVKGGRFVVSTLGTFSGIGAQFEAGYLFDLKGSAPVTHMAFSGFWGKNLKNHTYRYTGFRPLSKFPSEAKAKAELRELFRGSLKAARSTATGNIAKALSRFELPI